MNSGAEGHMKPILLAVSLFFLPFKFALADSMPVATATLTLNLSDVSFSGPVSPAPALDGFKYAIVESTFEANAETPFVPLVFDNEVSSTWSPVASFTQIAPGNYASADFTSTGTSTLFSTSAGAAGDAFLAIGGEITVTNGVLDIAVPYTFSADITGNCQNESADLDCPSAGVASWIVVHSLQGQTLANSSVCNQAGGLCTLLSSSGEVSGGGVASLDMSIPDGTYYFALQNEILTQSVPVPEPNAAGLCVMGLLGLLYLKKRLIQI
jgi:hypothetical protein